MHTEKIIVWQEGDAWIGCFEAFPDYRTQGDSIGDLREHLRDLHRDLTSGAIAGIRKP